MNPIRQASKPTDNQPAQDLETQPQKPQTQPRDESKIKNEAAPSSIASNTKPTSSPPRAGEFVAELRISKPEIAGEKSAQSGSSGKESKTAISDGGRAPSEKEDIKGGLSRMAQKLGVGVRIGNGRPASMTTLAGENNGASMVIGSDAHVRRGFKHHPKGGDIEASCENPAITASINSNVQSINNSALHGSSCNARDPGVHLSIISSKKVEAASPKGQTEPPKPEKTAPRIIPEQTPSQEPRIRRRCLRGLFMESSESDPEKPRRHGCRFSCDEKKKGKADAVAASTADGDARAKRA